MGLFKKLGKALGKVAKKVAKPVVSTIARTVVGSVPVLGGVVSAVGVVKASLHPPTRANTANLSARTGAPAFGHPGIMHRGTRATPHGPRRRPRAPAYGGVKEARSQHLGPYRRTRKRAAAGGTAKQRAARARFAKAARRGPIRKGTRL